MCGSAGLAQERWSRLNNININQNSQCLPVVDRDVVDLTMSCCAGGRRSQHNSVSIPKGHLSCAKRFWCYRGWDCSSWCFMQPWGLPPVGRAGEWCCVLILGAGSSCPWVSGFIDLMHCWHWVHQTLDHQRWHKEPETLTDHPVTLCCRVELSIVAKIF